MILRMFLTFWCCFKIFGAIFCTPKLYKTEGWTLKAKSEIGGYVIEVFFNLCILALMWL